MSWARIARELRVLKTFALLPLACSLGCHSEPSASDTTPAATVTGLSSDINLVWRRSPIGSFLEEAGVPGARAMAADNLAPDAVFKVSPAPVDGRIAGGASPSGSFEVEFNACRTSDPEGDRLFFSIDGDGDGRAEESGAHGGHCRRTISYYAEPGQFRDLRAEVCVVDLDAAGTRRRSPLCRTYRVEILGPAPALPCTVTPGTSSWLATGVAAIPGANCQCKTNGETISFAPDFTSACTAAGGGGGSWTGGGACSC